MAIKYLTEYRNSKVARAYVDEIHKITTRNWKIMEL